MNLLLPVLAGAAGISVAGLLLRSRRTEQELRAERDQLIRRLQELSDRCTSLQHTLEQSLSFEEEAWIRDVLPEQLHAGVVYMNTNPVEYGDHRQAVRELADALQRLQYIPHRTYIESRGKYAVYPQELGAEDNDAYAELLVDFYAVVWQIPHTTAERMVEESFRRGVGVSLKAAEDWWRSWNAKLIPA